MENPQLTFFIKEQNQQTIFFLMRSYCKRGSKGVREHVCTCTCM